MTEQLDPRLQTLFANSRDELEGETFVTGVVTKTRFLRYRLPVLLAGITLALAVCALLLAPSLQDFALIVAWGMTTSLVDLGDGWLAWVLMPVNTVGSLLILGAKVIRVAQKKITGASPPLR